MFFKGLLAGFCVAEFLWSFALHQFYFMGTDGYWWVCLLLMQRKKKKTKKLITKNGTEYQCTFFFCFYFVLLLEIYTNRFVFEFCNHQTPKPFALFFFLLLWLMDRCLSEWVFLFSPQGCWMNAKEVVHWKSIQHTTSKRWWRYDSVVDGIEGLWIEKSWMLFCFLFVCFFPESLQCM